MAETIGPNMDNSWPPRYRDYLAGSAVPSSVPAVGPAPHFEPRVLIVGYSDNTWSATHDSDDGLLGSFDSGTRDEAISWARLRCENILIYDNDVNDFIDLVTANGKL